MNIMKMMLLSAKILFYGWITFGAVAYIILLATWIVIRTFDVDGKVLTGEYAQFPGVEICIGCIMLDPSKNVKNIATNLMLIVMILCLVLKGKI